MSEPFEAPPMPQNLAKPEVKRGRRLSPIWAFPIVAVLVGAWLAYTTFSQRGPTITIEFKTAAGLEAGKTRVKYRDIDLGTVDRIEASPDLSSITVTARMHKEAEGHLTDRTRFWVVRPRFSLSGLSGLGTLVSGAYIEMDPDKGKPTLKFTGLEEPPVVRAETAGREFVLTTKALGSISPGSPIYYRGIQVGEVMKYDASDPKTDVKIHVFVHAPYDSEVYDNSHFWNASGISLSTGASGFKLEMTSLEAVLLGGIEFDSPDIVRQAEPSKELTSFTLFPDQASARDAAYTRSVRVIVEFRGSVHGLEVGSPVEFRGMKIGRVIDFYLIFDPASGRLQVPVTVEFEPERIRLASGDYDQFGSGRLMAEFVARGLRAQLKTASLLTGQLFVAFDFFPDAPPASIVPTATYPILPTTQNEMENITRSVSETLDYIQALPLDAMVADIRKVLVSADGIVGSPELKDAVRSLNKTLLATEHLANQTDAKAAPLLESLRQTSDAAAATIKRADATMGSLQTGYGDDSQIRRNLADLTRQLQDTARSIRSLADFVERHPEALIRGKAGSTP
jgi:paraquat-inducible protein B